MSSLLQDLRYAVRALRRSPGFTLAAVLTLALGIGATSGIFSVVNGVLLRPLPYPEADRLVVAWTDLPEFGHETASLPDFLDWRARSTSFTSMGAAVASMANLTGDGEPERIHTAIASADFLPTLGVRPVLGRAFTPDEERGVNRVALVSEGFWQRRLGGSRDVLGRSVTLNDRVYTVVGVLPGDLRVFPEPVDVWTPLRTDSADGRRSDYLTVVGRLTPGLRLEAAQDEMTRIARALAEEYPQTNAGVGIDLVPLREELVGDVRPALLVFMGAVGLVLLIACANVANLMLARATAREREIAIRATLGAGRAHIVRQLLTESVAVALAGAALGLLLAFWATSALRTAAASVLPHVADIGLDARVVLFTVALALLTGVLFGLAPALRAGRTQLVDAVREGARGTSGAGAGRLRAGLVLAEVALALVLLVGAGLLVRSFDRLLRVDPGFDPRGVLTMRVILPPARYDADDRARARQLAAQLVERARALPGVEAAAVSATLPTAGTPYNSFFVHGRPLPDPGTVQDAQRFIVSPDYFRVMGVRLVQGRLLTEQDDAGAPGAVVINETMARRYWSGASPLGQRITFGDPTDSTTPRFTVVGVVRDVKQEGLAAEAYSQLYQAYAQAPRLALYVTARTAGDPVRLAAALRGVIRELDASLPVAEVRSMEDRLRESVARPRLSMALLGGFAGVALGLAAIGIYGVMAYAVAQRTREIGIRMALGAPAGDVRRLVVAQGMTPALLGVILGLGGALLLTRLLDSLLYDVSSTDPLTFVAVATFLLAVALAASWLPARRATRVDPLIAMRSE